MLSSGKQYELVVFGATGYTGRLCAEYITMNLPTDLRWAVAGRSAQKLSALVRELKSLNPDREQPGKWQDRSLQPMTAYGTFLLMTRRH